MSQKTFNKLLFWAIVGLCIVLIWLGLSDFPASSEPRDRYLWDEEHRTVDPGEVEHEAAKRLYDMHRRRDARPDRHLEGQPRGRPAYRCYDDPYTGNVKCQDQY